MKRTLGVVLAAVVCAGCVEVQPFVKQADMLEPEKGYVAGWFDTTAALDEFAFGIVNARGEQYVMSFMPRSVEGLPVTPSVFSSDGAGKLLGIIALPPGDYRVGSWYVGRLAEHRNAVDLENPVGRPFEVQAGHVVFLGEFVARKQAYSRPNGYIIVWKIEPRSIHADEVYRQVATAYPNFAQAPLECVVCTAPADGAAAFARPASRGSDFSSKHDVVIHLHRRDEVYDGVRFNAWETFDGSWRRREVGGAGSLSAQSDGFGAYFVVNDLNFRNGRVNFQAQDPGRTTVVVTWSFSLAEGREVWVNDGDEKIYRTKDEAVAAQKR